MTRYLLLLGVALGMCPGCKGLMAAQRTVFPAASRPALVERPRSAWVRLHVAVIGVPTDSVVAVHVTLECVGRPGALAERLQVRAGSSSSTVNQDIDVPRCPTGGLPQVEVRAVPPLTRCDPATAPVVPTRGGLVANIVLACDAITTAGPGSVAADEGAHAGAG